MCREEGCNKESVVVGQGDTKYCEEHLEEHRKKEKENFENAQKNRKRAFQQKILEEARIISSENNISLSEALLVLLINK